MKQHYANVENLFGHTEHISKRLDILTQGSLTIISAFAARFADIFSHACARYHHQ